MERGCRGSAPISESRTDASRRSGRLRASDAAKNVDASGHIVAPGFVDLHTHYDAQLFWDPYCSISSWHGVTSIVIGNCGFGFAPVQPEVRERAMLTMTRVEAIPYASMKAGMPWDWTTFPEFLDSIDRRPKAVNILPYVSVSPLLTYVMGIEEAKTRPPTEQEEREICRLLDEAMDAGACGWSAQRLDPKGPACVQRDYDGTPMVSDLMTDDTCYALARVLGRRNEGFMQMTLVSGRIRARIPSISRSSRTSADARFSSMSCSRATRCRSSIAGLSRGSIHAVSAGCASTARPSPATPT